jgi:hypothetical protein
MAGGFLRPWRHLPLGCPAPGAAGGSPATGPRIRCHNCHGARDPGARAPADPVLHSPTGNSLQKSHTHVASMPYCLVQAVLHNVRSAAGDV